MAQKTSDNVLLLSTLSILQIIKEAQQQHGLRHGDYQRYRSYCARKLRRLRKSLHVTHGHKMRHFQHKTPTLDQISSDYRFLLISLFEAERCWAYSMQLKQEAEAQPRKKFHMINKLKKAVKHGCELENMCKSEQANNIDVATKLETQAYHAWLNGCLGFEMQDWLKAKDHFTASKTIYDNLSSASAKLSSNRGVDSGGRPFADIYQHRCQEMIDPQLRYCAFKIGDESAAADLVEMRRHMAADKENLVLADIDALIAQTREKQSEQLKSEVVWCNYKIDFSKVSNKVKIFRSSLKQFDSQLEQAETFDSKMAAYEQLLIDCRDAAQTVRDEHKNENFKQKSETGDEASNSTANENDSAVTVNDVQLLYFWLVYVRLAKTVEKYILLISEQRKTETTKPVKPQDMVRLYDAVLQNLKEIMTLPGTSNDPTFLYEVNTAIKFYNTFRCFYVAEVFGQQKKWREALALYTRAIEYCKVAGQNLKKIKAALFGYEMKSLDELLANMNCCLHTAHANAVAAGGQQQSMETFVPKPNEKVYIDEFKSYRRLNPQDVVGAKRCIQVTRMPPDFKAMPCKPVFFDLALNHMKFPSLDAKLGEEGAKKQTPENRPSAEGGDKAGLGGIVKGWFWGGKKMNSRVPIIVVYILLDIYSFLTVLGSCYYFRL